MAVTDSCIERLHARYQNALRPFRMPSKTCVLLTHMRRIRRQRNYMGSCTVPQSMT